MEPFIQRRMSGVICNSSKIERESLRDGGETCYGVWFLYSTTNKKHTGGRSGCDQLKEQYNVVLYFLYSFIFNYFDYLLSILSILILWGGFFFFGGNFYFVGSSFIFILLIGAQLKLWLL